ncbi:MAG: metallophosphoesterase [Verrucomicrobia bacterium]|nr:metallophosphoesterase [Verrucomicrobiota bacterium]
MRFAHISDLHFGSVCLSPLQFFSKRWLGNFNFLFNRRKGFDHSRLDELIDLFKAEHVTHVIITGDLTVTSRKIEFKKAKQFIDRLKREGFAVFTIPGNHDQYTKQSGRKRIFYTFFDSQFDQSCPLNLKDHRVTYMKWGQFWLVAIDTAVATPFSSSQGYFSPETEDNLKRALEAIPPKEPVILLNHFPFVLNDVEKKQLLRGAELKKLLTKYPNILLYLHGHSHRQTVADLRPNRLPILSDSGSTPYINNGACHLFDARERRLKLCVYRYDEHWKPDETHDFAL